MKNYLVLCYSKTGNSQFIGEKLAYGLSCDLKKIIPGIDSVFILYLLSLVGINIPTNISYNDIGDYDEVVIIGPVWGGQLISPLRTVLNICLAASKNIHFAVTCETKEEDRDSKYGYSKVLNKARDLGGVLVKSTEAFPTSLVNPDNKPWTAELSGKIKITPGNYDGPLKLRVENYVLKIKPTQQVMKEALVDLG